MHTGLISAQEPPHSLLRLILHCQVLILESQPEGGNEWEMPQFTCLCERCPLPRTKPSQVGWTHIPNMFVARQADKPGFGV